LKHSSLFPIYTAATASRKCEVTHRVGCPHALERLSTNCTI